MVLRHGDSKGIAQVYDILEHRQDKSARARRVELELGRKLDVAVSIRDAFAQGNIEATNTDDLTAELERRMAGAATPSEVSIVLTWLMEQGAVVFRAAGYYGASQIKFSHLLAKQSELLYNASPV